MASSGKGPRTTDPAVLAERMKKLLEEQRGAVAAALYQEGLAVDALAAKKTPVDTGRLRATHYVTPPVDTGSRITVEVGFGTDYAVFVHEDTAARHAHGEAKFLEKALAERSSGFLERLARRARSLAARGVKVVPLGAPTRPEDVGDIGPQFQPTRSTLGREKRRVRRAGRAAAKRGRRATKVTAQRAKKAAKRQARRELRRAKALDRANHKKMQKALKRLQRKGRRRRRKKR